MPAFNTIERTVDLKRTGVSRDNLSRLFAEGDNASHTFIIHVTHDGTPISVSSASAVGYFIRSDDYTVPINGSVSGNIVTVTFGPSCYVKEGRFNFIIRLTEGSVKTSIYWASGWIVNSTTDSIIDPGKVIPSIDELLAHIKEMEDKTAAANQAAQSANTAASSANTATTNANAARDAANTAAAAANKAKSDADAATKAANTAASAANTAKSNADTATASANAAAKSANDAAASVDAAKDAATKAAQSANTAASSANTATTNANAARDAANTAASAANTAASSANTAAKYINNLSVTAHKVAAGGAATATKSTNAQGGYAIDFGIPEGLKGNTGATPNLKIGTVSTGAAGTNASASITGTAENPLLNLTIPRGDLHGTSDSAAQLATSRNIFGRPFNGTADVTGNCTATCHVGTDASGLLIAPANKKTFSIRNDGDNTYFFIGDTPGSAEWNTARPFIINMATGKAAMDGHASEDVPTSRTVNGKALTGNISVNQLKNDTGVALLTVAGSDSATRSQIQQTVIDSAGNFRLDWGYEKSTDRGYIYTPGKTLQYLYSTTHKPTLAELGAQASLGFTPVQQSGGKDQLGNKIYIGWSSNKLKAQVDITDLGGFVFDSRTINGKPLSSNINLTASDVKAAAPNTDVHFNTIYNEAANGPYIGSSSMRRVYFRNDGNTFYCMIAKSTTDLGWSSPFPWEINISTGYMLVNGHANDDAYKAALVYSNAAPTSVQGPQTLPLSAHNNTAKLYAVVARSRTDNTTQGIVLATPGVWTTAVVRENATNTKNIYFRNVLVNTTLTGLQIEHGRISGDGGATTTESDVTCIITSVYAIY